MQSRSFNQPLYTFRKPGVGARRSRPRALYDHNPGFGRQKLNSIGTEKGGAIGGVAQKSARKILVEIDGGVSEKTRPMPANSESIF